MRFNEWLVVVLFTQVAIAAILLGCLGLNRIDYLLRKRRDKRTREQLFAYMQTPDEALFPKRVRPEFLLKILEEMEDAAAVETVCRRHLLPLARALHSGKSWKKRSFAARVFNLYAETQDHPFITKLLQDPVFLVRSIAALAAKKWHLSSELEQLKKGLPHETGYAKCFYEALFKENNS